MMFQYQGVDGSGQTINGSVEAADRRSAISMLATQGRYATELAASVSERSSSSSQSSVATDGGKALRLPVFRAGSMTGKDVLAVINQLRTALKAGLPLLNCLQIIREQQTKPAVREVLDRLISAVSSGSSLSEAMIAEPGVFTPLSWALVRVGETGGILEQTTEQLWQLLRREEQIKTNIKNAAAYPLIVLAVGLVSVGIVMTWILPKIIASIGMELSALPWPTRMLLALSDMIKSQGWWMAIAMVVGVVLFRRWSRTEQGRFRLDSFKLKVPVWSKVQVSIAVGRFARTLGALTRGGVTILEALKVVRDTLGNAKLARQIDAVAEKVKTGESVAGSLAASGTFPPLLVQITAVGEQSGRLDEMLLTAAETFDEEADAMITRFMAILPAVLILLLGIVVGFIVLGTLLPIVGMELGPGGL